MQTVQEKIKKNSSQMPMWWSHVFSWYLSCRDLSLRRMDMRLRLLCILSSRSAAWKSIYVGYVASCN